MKRNGRRAGGGLAAAVAATAMLTLAAQHESGEAEGGDPGAGLFGDAHATFVDRDGKTIGSATFENTTYGVLIHARLSGLAPGAHAFHIHETGRCEPPFSSAGGHFDPLREAHGLADPDGRHAGDLPNVFVCEDGTLEVEVLASEVTLSRTYNGLFDDDGSALVVHAGPDDYRTDPAGAAGERVACAVIERGPGAAGGDAG